MLAACDEINNNCPEFQFTVQARVHVADHKPAEPPVGDDSEPM